MFHTILNLVSSNIYKVLGLLFLGIVAIQSGVEPVQPSHLTGSLVVFQAINLLGVWIVWKGLTDLMKIHDRQKTLQYVKSNFPAEQVEAIMLYSDSMPQRTLNLRLCKAMFAMAGLLLLSSSSAGQTEWSRWFLDIRTISGLFSLACFRFVSYD